MQSELNKRLSEFITTERVLYDVKGDNTLTASISNISRYLRFLDILYNEYAELNDAYVAVVMSQVDDSETAASGKVPEGFRDRLSRMWEIAGPLQLKIESIVLFGAIALEKIEFAIRDYFGQDKSLSDDEWHRVAREKGIDIPADMKRAKKNLQNRLLQYRHEHITHNRNLRTLHGAGTNADGKTQIVAGFLYPDGSEKFAASPPVDEAIVWLDSYVKLFIELIVSNRAESQYKLKSG
ncbi:MAG: hypothetical protein IH989_00825 [Planctomycetes bacterium]|nr:hypothetical protein [Planctomycetota bacterium]